MVPYLQELSFHGNRFSKSFIGEGFEFLVDIDKKSFRLTIRGGLFYLEKAYVKFFVILYIQFLVYGLLGLVFYQPFILRILYFFTLMSPLLTYFYLYGYQKYQFTKKQGEPVLLSDQIFVHRKGNMGETKFANYQHITVYKGCIGFFLLVSNDSRTTSKLVQNRLILGSEFDFQTYMSLYDDKMTQFHLVVLTDNGKIIPVGDPRINPVADGLLDAVNYITDQIPEFQNERMDRRVFQVEKGSFLIDAYYEVYSSNYDPIKYGRGVNA